MRVHKGVTARVVTATAAASLVGGLAAASVPAQAATAKKATAVTASTCSPKTDYEYHVPGYSAAWSHVCGIGTWSMNSVTKVRDATFPYHRIWIHAYDINGTYLGAWCAWGPNDTTVPAKFYNNGDDLQVSANTASC